MAMTIEFTNACRTSGTPRTPKFPSVGERLMLPGRGTDPVMEASSTKPAGTRMRNASTAISRPEPSHRRRNPARVLGALVSERGSEEKIWGSMVKQALKRRKPGFNEGYYGFSSFNRLLEEAQSRRELALERDEKSGGYVVRAFQD